MDFSLRLCFTGLALYSRLASYIFPYVFIQDGALGNFYTVAERRRGTYTVGLSPAQE